MDLDRRTAIAIAAAGLAGGAARSQPARRLLDPGREVLAFYYGWYGNPTVSQRWRHWQGPTGQEAPDQSPLLDHPKLGLYDSHDPQLISRHADMLKRAGFTGIISSWWGQGSFEDRSLSLLLDAMHARGIKICAYLEQQKGGAAGAASDLAYLTSRYGAHPAWLRVGGRPVFFIYLGALRQLAGPAWRAGARQVAAAGMPEPVLIGDVNADHGDYPDEAAPFDGTHTYVLAPYIQGRTPAQITAYTDATYPIWKAKFGAKIRTATIDPGFDDRQVPGRKAPRPVLGRYGTGTFDALWRAAIKTDADWALVTSFNEWHEGSEIEPSIEYGDAYITDNARWAKRFLAAR